MATWEEKFKQEAADAGQSIEKLKLILKNLGQKHQDLKRELSVNSSDEPHYNVEIQIEQIERSEEISDIESFGHTLCLYIIQLQLNQFNATLSSKLANPKHLQNMLGIHDLIFENIEQLLKTNKKNKLSIFKNWFQVKRWVILFSRLIPEESRVFLP